MFGLAIHRTIYDKLSFVGDLAELLVIRVVVVLWLVLLVFSHDDDGSLRETRDAD